MGNEVCGAGRAGRCGEEGGQNNCPPGGSAPGRTGMAGQTAGPSQAGAHLTGWPDAAPPARVRPEAIVRMICMLRFFSLRVTTVLRDCCDLAVDRLTATVPTAPSSGLHSRRPRAKTHAHTGPALSFVSRQSVHGPGSRLFSLNVRPMDVPTRNRAARPAHSFRSRPTHVNTSHTLKRTRSARRPCVLSVSRHFRTPSLVRPRGTRPLSCTWPARTDQPLCGRGLS